MTYEEYITQEDLAREEELLEDQCFLTNQPEGQFVRGHWWNLTIGQFPFLQLTDDTQKTLNILRNQINFQNNPKYELNTMTNTLFFIIGFAAACLVAALLCWLQMRKTQQQHAVQMQQMQENANTEKDLLRAQVETEYKARLARTEGDRDNARQQL